MDGGDDTLKRQDMFVEGPWRLGSAIPDIDKLNYIGTWTPRQTTSNWKIDPYLSTSHALYQTVRQLIHIRRSCVALTQGSLVWHLAQPSTLGVLIFSRVFKGTEVVVIINPSAASISIAPIPIDNVVNFNVAFQKYINVLYSNQNATVGYANNQGEEDFE
jgi:hypothetical protein